MKKVYRGIGCLSLVFLLTPALFGSAGQKDEKDAPETLIKVAKFLEQKPLDKDAKKLRSWAIQWIIATDKVSVKACSLISSGVEKYKYSSELFGQYTIAMAAYKLANPDKKQDEDAAQQAGIESALSSYESLVSEQPKAKNGFMDDLLAKRSQGALAGYVKEHNCTDGK